MTDREEPGLLLNRPVHPIVVAVGVLILICVVALVCWRVFAGPSASAVHAGDYKTLPGMSRNRPARRPSPSGVVGRAGAR